MWGELRVLLAVVLLGLSACSGDSGKEIAFPAVLKPKPAPMTKNDPSSAEQTAGMVLAASGARSEPIAELKFELHSRPTAGRPLRVDLALLPRIDAAVAAVEITGSDGLSVADGDAAMDFSDVLRRHVYRKSVTVTPSAEGVFYLNAAATLKGTGFSEVRNFSIPIIASSAGQPAVPDAIEPTHKAK